MRSTRDEAILRADVVYRMGLEQARRLFSLVLDTNATRLASAQVAYQDGMSEAFAAKNRCLAEGKTPRQAEAAYDRVHDRAVRAGQAAHAAAERRRTAAQVTYERARTRVEATHERALAKAARS
jgi:hypothetical protein